MDPEGPATATAPQGGWALAGWQGVGPPEEEVVSARRGECGNHAHLEMESQVKEDVEEEGGEEEDRVVVLEEEEEEETHWGHQAVWTESPR